MEIVKIHINNFGKFHNVDIDLKEGVNSFLYENGWGKTTLSVFIKSMFYGMEYTKVKDIERNERDKYFPWQGGVYGGSMIFCQNGKEYLVNRTFGLKKNEDTFELRDLKTNKISNDFSEDLGTEIFGINRDSYARSVFVTLKDSPVGSADITAKLNNLVESGDISNFEEAAETLEKKAKGLHGRNRGTGEIPAIQQKIDANRNYIEEIDSKLKENATYEEKVSVIQKEILELKKQQESVAEQISVCAKFEGKTRYEQLKNDLKKSENERKSLCDFFNGQIPDEETVKKIDLISNNYTTIESNIKNQSASQSEKDSYEALKNYFAGDIPTKSQIEECLKTDNEYKNFKQAESAKKLTQAESAEFYSLSQKYKNSDVSKEKIDGCISDITKVQQEKNKISELKNELLEKENELNALLQQKQKNPKKIVFGALGFLGLAAGIFGFVLNNIILGLSGVVVFLLFMILAIVLKGKKQDFSEFKEKNSNLKKEILEKQSHAQNLEAEYKKFIKKYSENEPSEIGALTKISTEFSNYSRLLQKENEYKNWLNTQKITPEEYETKIWAFTKRYCKAENIFSVPADIQILNEKLAKLDELKKKINADSENLKIQQEEKSRLDAILSQYKTEKTLSYANQVLQIHSKLMEIKNVENQILSEKKKIELFENDPNNKIESFENLKKPEKPVDVLQNELSAVSEKISSKNKILSDYQKIISDNLADTEKKGDIETEIERLTLEKHEKSAEYEIFSKTLELLQKAKENLDANYSDPMKKGFEKYVKMLGSSVNLIINTDLEVLLDDNGKAHKSNFLSDGYKDMVNFCSRMALVDALFENIKPPIILDDPFVNLDDEKIPNALQLVKEIAKENQVIYFACHKSRAV